MRTLHKPSFDGLSPDRLVRHVPLAPHQHLLDTTPTPDVFRLSHVGVPRTRADDWWLDVAGFLGHPRRLTLKDLERYPQREVTSLHQCAGFPTRPDVATRRVANVVWSGVELRRLLDEAVVLPGAAFVWSFGVDHGRFEHVASTEYLKDLPLSRLADGDVLVALAMNGEPLPREHGFPLRLVVPGFYGTNSTKWLYRIEVSDRRPDGPFTRELYNDPVDLARPDGPTRPVWNLAPESLIVHPAPGQRLSRQACRIWGRAWADAPVGRVEVSVDDGAVWSEADLQPRRDRGWQRFEWEWRAPRSGRHVLAARAYDVHGVAQASDHARNAVHRVAVEVI